MDICELVSLEAVQSELGLGPNGGLVYCMDYLEANLDWLRHKLEPLEAGERRRQGSCGGKTVSFAAVPACHSVLQRAPFGCCCRTLA